MLCGGDKLFGARERGLYYSMEVPLRAPTRCLLGLLIGISAPLSAQTIRGRIVLPDSVTPIASATLVVRNDTGAVVGRVASAEDGRYSMRLPRPGRYELQSIRIGFAPVRIPLGDLARGEERTVDVVMAEQPLELAAVEVQGNDRCRMSRGERERFVQLWQSARSALGTHVAAGNVSVQMRVLDLTGTEDGPTRDFGYEVISNPRDRHPDIDSVTAREHFTTDYLATTPWETVLLHGYVQRLTHGDFVFHVPNPESLLSDAFLTTHCFDLANGPLGHRDWVGLRFRPSPDPDSLSDIRGTLWVEAESAFPRRLDYEYRNIPLIPYLSCDVTNRPIRLPFGEVRFGPNCWDALRGEPSPREGIGGTIEFARAVPDRWFVSRWRIRSPGTEFVDRYLGYSTRPASPRRARCTDRPPACSRTNWAMPRLIVLTGAVAVLEVDGEVVYSDAETHAAMARIAALQTTAGAGHLTGVILDRAGLPVPGAIVTTDSPVRATMTDSSGVFEIRTLPTEALMVHVTKEGFSPGLLRVVPTRDTILQIAITLSRKAAPERVGRWAASTP